MFLSLPNIFGQVVIKEHVKVESKETINSNKLPISSGVVTHTLKLVADYSADPSCDLRFEISFCNKKIYSAPDNTGHLEYEFTVSYGATYELNISYQCDNSGCWHHIGVPFAVYVDGDFYKDGASSYVLNNGTATSHFWYAKLGVRIWWNEEKMYSGTSEEMSINTQNGCAPIIGTSGVDYPTISIINGSKYLSFYTSYNGQFIGNSYNAGEYTDSLPVLKNDTLYYGGEELLCVVQAEANGVVASDTVMLEPMFGFEIDVKSTPDTLLKSEESSIVLKKILNDGNETKVDFPAEQLFDVEIIEGAKYGSIISIEDTADIFMGIEQGFKFKASNSIDKDSVEVLVKVSTTIVDEDEQIDWNKLKGQDVIAPAGGGGGGERTIYGTTRIKIKSPSKEILLGETKYFGVKKKGDEYEILEIPTTYGSEPKWKNVTLSAGWEWIKNDDVWGTDPVEKLGSKSGVYWEKKWYNKTTNKNKNIPAGMIRLIGRYWEKGKEDDFKVKLKTTKNIDVVVKVIKPNELGDKNHKPKDVFNTEISVDDSCIVTGGKYGIPPQIIKGHMRKETDFRNSFRYEPGVDIKVQKNPDKYVYLNYSYYKITSSNMGTISMPTNHTNVNPVPYVTTKIQIKDYVYTHLDQYIARDKDDKNKPYFLGMKNGTLSDTIKYFYDYAKDTLNSKTPFNDSKDSLKAWLKRGKYDNGDKYCQTRIFSSYGMLQQTFYAANDEKLAGFSVSNDKLIPEKLNELHYSLKAYSEKMDKKLKNKTSDNWNNGYEEDWIKILHSYNKYEKGYGKSAFNFSKNYLPKKWN